MFFRGSSLFDLCLVILFLITLKPYVTKLVKYKLKNNIDVISKRGIIDLIDKRQLKQLNVVNNGLLIRLAKILISFSSIIRYRCLSFLESHHHYIIFPCPSCTLGLDRVSERASC